VTRNSPICLEHAEDLVRYLLGRFGERFGNRDFLFRGEPAHFPSVASVLDRLSAASGLPIDVLVQLEIETIRKFVEDAYFHLDSAERDLLSNHLWILPLMRHWGAPTRLLDWTESPWVALYFACASHFDKAGRILVLDRPALTNTVHGLHADQTKLIDHSGVTYGSIPIPALLAEDPAKLDDWLVCFHHIGPRFPRIVAQQGVFTLASKPRSDHWRLAHSLSPGGCYQICIPAMFKRTCIRTLEVMGITAATLFPGVDGVAQSRYIDLAVKLSMLK
jgi:hypothetical protein